MFQALAADLPHGHPGRHFLVFQQDFAQFQERNLVSVWRKSFLVRYDWRNVLGRGGWSLTFYDYCGHGLVLSLLVEVEAGKLEGAAGW